MYLFSLLCLLALTIVTHCSHPPHVLTRLRSPKLDLRGLNSTSKLTAINDSAKTISVVATECGPWQLPKLLSINRYASVLSSDFFPSSRRGLRPGGHFPFNFSSSGSQSQGCCWSWFPCLRPSSCQRHSRQQSDIWYHVQQYHPIWSRRAGLRAWTLMPLCCPGCARPPSASSCRFEREPAKIGISHSRPSFVRLHRGFVPGQLDLPGLR